MFIHIQPHHFTSRDDVPMLCLDTPRWWQQRRHIASTMNERNRVVCDVTNIMKYFPTYYSPRISAWDLVLRIHVRTLCVVSVSIRSEVIFEWPCDASNSCALLQWRANCLDTPFKRRRRSADQTICECLCWVRTNPRKYNQHTMITARSSTLRSTSSARFFFFFAMLCCVRLGTCAKHYIDQKNRTLVNRRRIDLPAVVGDVRCADEDHWPACRLWIALRSRNANLNGIENRIALLIISDLAHISSPQRCKKKRRVSTSFNLSL